MTQQHKGLIDVSTTFQEQDGRLFIGRSQDCTAIAEDAKRRHNAGEFGTSELKHAARIPNVIVEQYCNDTGVSFEQFMADPVHIKRVVQDPKNDAFRIWKGAL
ncbi:hypothetical protein INH39_25580 [Massilia violaceinigra]|uniref:GIY-YIG domain-containing protein n=1 Tax=Massilia violaceinigra TaxID=2045208 RepID=A0ABY4A283_9BURK|nr:hypothetical protein [Massilia violaceinigra]UOD28783.1 hypothetical protein INH39_25580 [Massilia violaceinigra]